MPKARRSNVLTTVVFTDIVGSTKVAEEMGDRRWRELLARHHGLLRDALKILRRMVYLAMGEVVHGRFHGGVLQGTLANGGVGLAPFYGLGGRVPVPVRRQLEQIKRGIVNGSISVDPRSYPAH